MNRRAVPALVLLLAAFAALFVVGRDTVASPAPVFLLSSRNLDAFGHRCGFADR